MEEKPDNTTLVTIIVITYNSENYVLETLESTLIQSHQNLELIISDDGSNDRTKAICQNWLSKHSKRFFRTEFVTTEVNTGIPANCNRGLSKATGEWIKLIAGDDILLPNCVTDLLDFAKKNGYKQVVSEIISLEGSKQYHNTYYKNERELFFKLNVKEKYQYYLAYPFPINACSLLFEKELIENFAPFDEDFRILEDLPFFFTLLKNGIDIGCLKKATVLYRVHSNSLTGSVNIEFFKTLHECYLKYRKPFLPGDIKGRLLKFFIKKHFQRQIYHNNKNSFWQKGMIFFYDFLIRRLSSIFYLH